MAKKGTMPNFKTVAEYINHQPNEVQPTLIELNNIILETVPEAIEIKDYKVPAYTLVPTSKPQLQIMFMAGRNFVSLYVYQKTINHFLKELNNYELGKGTVKFFVNKPLPKSLIKKLVEFRKNEFL